MHDKSMTKFLRNTLQEKLEQGNISSLAVQVISLIYFAEHLANSAYCWVPVSKDIRKGFTRKSYGKHYFMSLDGMQRFYNRSMIGQDKWKEMDFKVVQRVSIQYHKRTTKKLSSELHWLKFIKED